MAPRKSTSKGAKPKKSLEPLNLNLEDVMCPICLSILIEPVSMPCSHALCIPCFDENVSKSSLTCPLCRERISVWVRHATKAGTLIDVRLWKYIQEKFRDKVEARLRGADESDDEGILVPMVCVSDPGEIKAEFEAQLERENKEAEERKRQEEEASTKLIKLLQEEEHRKLRERQERLLQATENDEVLAKGLIENQQEIERNIRIQDERDGELARRLRKQDQEEIIKSPSANKFKKMPQTPSIKKGPMDIYMGQMTPLSAGKLLVPDISYDPVDHNGSILPAQTPGRSREDNSIHQLGEASSPKKKLFGRQLREIIHSQSSESECDDIPIQSENNKKNISKTFGKENLSRKDNGGRVKGKSIVPRDVIDGKAMARANESYDSDETDMEDEVFINDIGHHTQKNNVGKRLERTSKRKTERSLRSPKNSTSIVLSNDKFSNYDEVVSLDAIVAEQATLEKRLQLEENDRLVALALQEELNQQMRQVVRTRGSEDEYILRDRKATVPPTGPWPPTTVTSINNISRKSRKSCIADVAVVSTQHMKPSRTKHRQTTLFENINKRKRTL